MVSSWTRHAIPPIKFATFFSTGAVIQTKGWNFRIQIARRRLNFRKTCRWLFVRCFPPIFGFAIAIFALYWLFQEIDVQNFLTVVFATEKIWILVLAVAILLEQLTRGWKWRQIIFELKPVAAVRLFCAIVAGNCVIMIVPLGVGSLVRSWLIARLEGLRWASVLMTTAVERFLDGLIFTIFLLATAFVTNILSLGGGMRTGLVLAGLLNLLLFLALFSALFFGRTMLDRDHSRISRLIDWLATKGGKRLYDLRAAVLQGIIWPRNRRRQLGAVLASILMKIINATQFKWAGLAVGIVLTPYECLFVMVFSGIAIAFTRFIRVPHGFLIGSGFALELLGVPTEQALAIILFNHTLTVVFTVAIGLGFMWKSGFQIRDASLLLRTQPQDM